MHLVLLLTTVKAIKLPHASRSSICFTCDVLLTCKKDANICTLHAAI